MTGEGQCSRGIWAGLLNNHSSRTVWSFVLLGIRRGSDLDLRRFTPLFCVLVTDPLAIAMSSLSTLGDNRRLVDHGHQLAVRAVSSGPPASGTQAGAYRTADAFSQADLLGSQGSGDGLLIAEDQRPASKRRPACEHRVCGHSAPRPRASPSGTLQSGGVFPTAGFLTDALSPTGAFFRSGRCAPNAGCLAGGTSWLAGGILTTCCVLGRRCLLPDQLIVCFHRLHSRPVGCVPTTGRLLSAGRVPTAVWSPTVAWAFCAECLLTAWSHYLCWLFANGLEHPHQSVPWTLPHRL